MARGTGGAAGSVSAAAEAYRILAESTAILEGDHFVYVSGDHGSGWIDKDAMYPHTDRTARLAALLADAVGDWRADVVCGPAIGGLIAATWLAHRLSVLSVFCERDKAVQTRPGFVLRRGYDQLVAGRRVLVVDDIVNTGHSIRHAVNAVRAAGGELVGAAAFVNRGNVGAREIGVDEFRFLVEVHIPSWPADSCELCKEGVPVNTRFAHGAEFVAARGHQPAP